MMNFLKKLVFKVEDKYFCPRCGAKRTESKRIGESMQVIRFECAEVLNITKKNGKYKPVWGHFCKGVPK